MTTPYCPSCESPTPEGAAACSDCGAERPVEGWPTDALLGGPFLDQYTVIRRLGSGGFGVVYLAENKEFGAKRAIKILDARHVHNDNILRRFKREAKALYRLQSPYTVRVERWGRTADGHYYLVMEFAEGETLRQVLERRGHLDERRALAIARQTAVALSDAHDLGILHRDLKPENLVVRRHPHEGERIAVLDFGISKILADETTNRRSGLVGTPSYMAPETFRPTLGPQDIRADLWSLGVILYEMLTGHLPHGDETLSSSDPMATGFQVAHLEPAEVLESLDALNVHSKTRAILERLLQQHPEDRYTTPADLVADLDAHPLWATEKRRLSQPDTPLPAADRRAPTQRSGDATADTVADRPAARARVELADTVQRPGAEDSFDFGDGFTFEEEPPEHLRISRPSADSLLEERRGPSLGVVLIAIAVLGLIALGAQLAGNLFGGPPASPDAADTGADASADAPLVQLPATQETVDGVTQHLVPGASFVMGVDEPATMTPPHTVVLDSFYLDEGEVTVGMWRDCMQQQRCRPEQAITAGDREGCRTLDGSAAEASLPMNCVTWEGAKTYCELYGRRLPTEAEWEYAARGPDGPVEVGSDSTSPFGVVALADGLGEWVSDWYASDWYDVSPTFDPQGTLFGTERVVRGVGATRDEPPRLVDRDQEPPDTASPDIGFRCAQDAE